MHPAAIVGICIGAYIVIAAVAVRVFPFGYSEAAKKKKRMVKFPTARVGHRGGSLNGPENTMWTFRRTARESDILELDVAITADGKVVVTHDAELGRQVGGEFHGRKINEFPHEDLPLLAKEIPLHFPSLHAETYALSEDQAKADSLGMCTEQQPFALLEEVFESFPTTPIHLDMKFTSHELVLKTMDLVDQFNRQNLTILGAATGANVASMRKEVKRRQKLNPGRKYLTFSSFGEVVKTYLLFYTGLLPIIPLDFDCFSIPMMTRAKKNLFAQRNFSNACVRTLAVLLLTSPTLWNHLRRRGIIVLGFVLNDPEEWEEVKGWPIDGIMTDDPLRLNRHMVVCSSSPKCVCPPGHDPIPLGTAGGGGGGYGSTEAPGSNGNGTGGGDSSTVTTPLVSSGAGGTTVTHRGGSPAVQPRGQGQGEWDQ